MKKIIGLIVNPVAGMGGSVGLKGTDGEMYKKALELGAKPVTPFRTEEFLSNIENKDEIILYTAPGKMGEDYVKSESMEVKIIGKTDSKTTSEDTKKIAKEMIDQGVKLLVFVGGDGTARDIHDAVNSSIPVVAVPSGVKVFSSVFAVSTRAAAKMIDAFLNGTELVEEEVLDIDEDAFRNNRLAAKLYGYLTVPNVRNVLQGGKQASNISESAVENKRETAEYIVESMEEDTLYILGPGTTLKAVADKMCVKKTLLGIDAVFNERLVASDINEQKILKLFKNYKKRKIIVTPIGGNGFIFGRGSKQFTPEVLKQTGRDNIIIVGTRDKINTLDCLRVDTGDFAVDKILSGHIRVTVGYKEELLMDVKC